MKNKLYLLLACVLTQGLAFAQAPNVSYGTPKFYNPGVTITPLVPVNTGGAVGATVSTLAGSGTSGSADGIGTTASFNGPLGICMDVDNNIYIADTQNHLIRKMTPAGVVTTLAGSGSAGFANGTGMAASFNNPSGVCADTAGNIYVADSYNNKIRKISPAGEVTTLAGGNGSGAIDGVGILAYFSQPGGVCADAAGNVYVADTGQGLIRKITPAGVVTTLAGGGAVGTAGKFYAPRGICTDAIGNIYVADTNNNLIKKISLAGEVSILAGSGTFGSVDGIGSAASFNEPVGISIDAAGDLYVAEESNKLIRKITLEGVVTTVAGSKASNSNNGAGTASLDFPSGVCIDAEGNLYIAEEYGNKIRKIILGGADDGYTIVPTLPMGLSFDPLTGVISGIPTTVTVQNTYTITVTNTYGSSITNLDIVVGIKPAISYPTATQTNTVGTAISNLTPANAGTAITYKQVTTFAGNGTATSTDGTGTAAGINNPYGAVVDSQGNTFVTDTNSHKIRKITPSGVATTFAGSGASGSADATGSAASFNHPEGIAIDKQNNLYVADVYNNKIRKISPAGVVTTLAGNGQQGSADGTGTAALFYSPTGIAVDAINNIYVVDQGNNKIRKITPSGTVSTLAGGNGGGIDYAGNPNGSGADDGTGITASFNSPRGIAIDSKGNAYVTDGGNQKIRKITPAGVVTSFAGTLNQQGSVDGLGADASFYYPTGITADSQDNIYVISGHLIRKITLGAMVSTIAGGGGSGTDYFGNPDGSGANDGIGIAAGFNTPSGITVDSYGTLYIVDTGNNKIRKMYNGYAVTPALPTGLNLDPATGTISGTPTLVSSQRTYTVSAVNDLGVGIATVGITVNSNLGVEDVAFKDMMVYPNPTTGEVNISNVMVEKVNVYNNVGQLVKTINNPEAVNATTIQLNDLPTGIYLMFIETENARAVKQVIKQ